MAIEKVAHIKDSSWQAVRRSMMSDADKRQAEQ
jgi:hypothetical protein